MKSHHKAVEDTQLLMCTPSMSIIIHNHPYIYAAYVPGKPKRIKPQNNFKKFSNQSNQ